MASLNDVVANLQVMQRQLADQNRLMAQMAAVRAGAGASGVSLGRGGALGLAASLQGMQLAVGAVTRVFRELEQTTRESIRLTKHFADQRLFGGGTTGQTALASQIAASIGVDEAAGMAARLRDRIAAGGTARYAASQLGVGNVLPRGTPGSTTNDVELLIRIADQIRRIGDVEKVRLLAIQLQEPELLRITQMTRDQQEQAARLARIQAQINTPETQRRAEQFAIAMQQIGQRIDLLKNQFGAWFLQNFGGLIGATGEGAAGGARDAISRNTQALEMNTVALQNMGRNIYGGGSRARGALPAGLRGEILRHAMEGEALRMGAFKL